MFRSAQCQKEASEKGWSVFVSMWAVLWLALSSAPAMAAGTELLVDFEGGEPAGWFVFSGGGASVATAFPTIADSDPLARPGQVGDNTLLDATFDVTAGFGGFGQDYSATGSRDWSTFTAISFWLYGGNSGQSFQFEIFDNRSDPSTDTAERFEVVLLDDFSGWQKVTIPFTDFTRATDFQPGGAPDDGLTLTEMWGFAGVLDGAAGTLRIDDIALERRLVDDFESGLPSGTDGDGNPIGFFTFQDASSTVEIGTTDTLPDPVPGSVAGNHVLQVSADVSSFAGLIHAFENAALDTWVPQDWSTSTGICFWLFGNNTGVDLFVDILDNRAPGTTGDTAERYTVTFVDDFSGWQLLEFPFADFARKGIGNGAPNDGLGLTEVHGWAFGLLNTGGPVTHYLDDVALFGSADVPELAVGFVSSSFDIEEGATGQIEVGLSRPMNDDDPAQVSVAYTLVLSNATPERDYVPFPDGTLTFVNGGPSAQSFPIVTIDDDKYEPTERLVLQLSNPVDVEIGFLPQATADILDNDPFDPRLLDDFEGPVDLWSASPGVTLSNPEIPAGDPMAVPEQGAYERVLSASLPLGALFEVQGRICDQGNGVIPVILYSTEDFDATTVDHASVMLGNAYETHVDQKTGVAKRHEEDADGDGDLDLVFHFRFAETGLPCDPEEVALGGETFDGRPVVSAGTPLAFGRAFALGQDWSTSDGLSFYYFGQDSGEEITVELRDNRAPDPGPAGWSLVWSDEFDDPAGTPPNPALWSLQLGDGALQGVRGWGNDELQYYTDSVDNASTDGQGNLVITARQADGSLGCFYGVCEYTSARLESARKAEFAYGRIESRILVPSGEAGLWPAFWSLGTDIDLVGWPQTGEIDIMEYVSRIPTEIFGTIHGPGYAGGASFGSAWDFGEPVANDYHTFTIEWQPDRILWFVDGILYHSATPADVAPNEWVFNDPLYLLFNLAIGGNFGGALSPDLVFPQEMRVDYVRVYQGPDTAERFETSFVDDFAGWQQVAVPFSNFTRRVEQPVGAPDDGLTLDEVWGYGFELPASDLATLWLDQVRLTTPPPPSELVVTNPNDSGAGSLRQALDLVADSGSVFFDPGLAGGTIALISGPLVVDRVVTIDGSDAPELGISGGNIDRVLIVDPTGDATLRHLTVTEGYGFQLAGGILNNGSLTLDHVTVSGNVMTTDAGDFWQGGAGIYNGEGASLELIDSTVTANSSGWAGGGVFSFFGTTTTIVRSTISGNSAADVGGGLRLLGNADIVNSTLSGNTATGWHGGAFFLTDGVVNMTNSTVSDNLSPVGTAEIFVGTFTPSSASLNLQNNVVDDVGTVAFSCFLAPFGTGAVAINSLGNNVFTDGTCDPIGSDQIVLDAGLGLLADNGGPTLTHALLAGSAAIDAANSAACPATDQRGVSRDAACDAGAFEFVP